MELEDLIDTLKPGEPVPEDLDVASVLKDVIAQTAEQHVQPLKAKNQELLGKMKQLKEKVSAIPEDFDPEKWNELKALLDKKNKGQQEPGEEERIKQLREQLEQQYQEKLTEVEQQAKTYKSALEQRLLDGAAVEALSKAKGNVDLLLPHVKSHLRVVEEDGKFHVVVVDDAGEIRYSLDPKRAGQPMSVGELVAEMKAKDAYAPAFEFDNAGGGASGSGRSGMRGIKNPWKKETLNYTEQARIRREDPDLARQLAAAAGVEL